MDKEEKIDMPCFGILDNVFPKGDDGLRSAPDFCLACMQKTDCLKTAMKGTDGLKAREELIDRAYDSGVIGFFKRWSQKKGLYNLRKKRKGAIG